MAAKNTAADAPDHRPVPAHEGCKSRFVTAADVVLQQFPIGQSHIFAQHRAKVLDDTVHLAGWHVPSIRATVAIY
jgi:hypothetical protein